MAALAGLLWIASAAAGLTEDEKCEAAKNKIAGQYAFCRQKAEAKAIKTGNVPDYSKCDAKFSDKWAGAEAKAGGACPTDGDEAAVQGCVSAHADRVAAALGAGGICAAGGLPQTGQTRCDPGAGSLAACPAGPLGQDGALRTGLARSFTDNGDGTITDNVTGLMWEKLSNDGSIHDWDDIYTWDDAFDVKLAALNAGAGFAGHTDWRLPNQFEIYSLADLGRTNPAIDPAFHANCTPACTVTTCSCTTYIGVSTHYWSATTTRNGPNIAWYLEFNVGDGGAGDKTNGQRVRAVRGGL